MKRIAAAALMTAILTVGCESDGGLNNPFEKKPAAAAKTPDQADYFELKKDGKTYILGSNASREAYLAGNMPPLKDTKFDNGKSAMVENSSYADYNRLVAEYKKAKGL